MSLIPIFKQNSFEMFIGFVCSVMGRKYIFGSNGRAKKGRAKKGRATKGAVCSYNASAVKRYFTKLTDILDVMRYFSLY